MAQKQKRGRSCYSGEVMLSAKTILPSPSTLGPSKKSFNRERGSKQGPPSWTRKFGDSNEPHHKATQKDVQRQLCAFSRNKDGWVDIDATFVDDLDENWISKDFVDRLGLKAKYSEPKEYGHLEASTLPFLGTVELQWSEKSGKDFLRSRYAICKIVNHKSFEVFLKISSLPGGRPQSLPATPVSTVNLSPIVSSAPLNCAFLSSPGPTALPLAGSFDGSPIEYKEDSPDAITADDWINRLKKSVHTRIAKIDTFKRHKPVQIAVLDTGVDTKHHFVKGAIRGGRILSPCSFVKNDTSIEDTSGHGTHIATLLLEVAPDAEIHIARVAQDMGIPYTHSIADAIRWAIELGVDIINLSFGLEREDTDVQQAIREAVCQNIIIFAAASNDGGNTGVMYPARKDEVICIYATDGIGSPFTGNPTRLKTSCYHFAALGVGVKSSWPSGLQGPMPKSSEPSERRMTGTSCATPIAAGIAACIIEFAYRIGFPEPLLKLLKSREGMQKVLRGLMVSEQRRHDLHYIHPWVMFAGKSDEEILHLMKHYLER